MIRDKFCFALLLLIATMLYSCKDSKLAKEMEGTWTTSYVTSYEDGTKSYVDEQITFKNDDTNKDGGSFFEIRTGKEEIDEDEGNIKYRWISKIEGTWKINIEDLVLYYNMSTLDVEVGKEDVDFKLKDEALGEALLSNNLGSLIMGGMYLKANLYKELKKDAYRQLFRYYQKSNNDVNDNGILFSEVQINGSVLSYNTSDMGRIEYHRVRGGISPKHNNNNSSLSNNENNYNNSEEFSFTHQLSGYVDKYKIYMFLNIDDNGKVSGYYYYDSQGPDKLIDLSGIYQQSDGTNQLTLNCDNQDIFDGYIDDTKYSGEFTNTNNKKLFFNLRYSQ